MYICHSVIQRDPEIWGASADVFVPERWLDETATSDPNIASAAKCRATAPVSAWRPFERGPRNCIGQDFAKIEAYVILAVVARRYELSKWDWERSFATSKAGQSWVRLVSMRWSLRSTRYVIQVNLLACSMAGLRGYRAEKSHRGQSMG